MQKSNVMGDFVRDLLEKEMREDGRKMFDFRNIDVKTKVIPNAEGSAQVMIGHTKVICGVKFGVGSPMPDKPKEGNIITGAELLPLASRHYDVGPPTPEAIEVARVIDRGIRAAGMVDTEALFIEEGKVWETFIDVYVLNASGNLFDAGTLAAATALSSARFPKYEDGKVIREGNLPRFKASNLVTSCTFAKLYGKIVLDPDMNEEELMETRLTIANDEKDVRAMQKGLYGSFSVKEIEKLLEVSFEKSKDLRELVKRSVGD